MTAYIERLECVADAARLLIADVKRRHPDEDLVCTYLIALENSLRQAEAVKPEETTG